MADSNDNTRMDQLENNMNRMAEQLQAIANAIAAGKNGGTRGNEMRQERSDARAAEEIPTLDNDMAEYATGRAAGPQESTVVREQNEKKRRKLKSKVWDEFTRTEPGKDGKPSAICNHCRKKFDGWSKKGTTHLKNHLASKTCRDMRNGGNVDKSTKTRDKSATHVVMEEKSSVIDLIKQSFEGDGYWTENWDPSVLNYRKDEILEVYQEEKEKLGEFLSKLSCRFSLYVDDMDEESGDNLVLRVHYIDDSWERQSKIIGILPRDYENWIEETKELCSELKIDRNICCIILNGEGWMEDGKKEVIGSWCSQRGSLPFAGFALDFKGFLRMSSYFAWNLNEIEIDDIEKCVGYIYEVAKNVNFNNSRCDWIGNPFECLKAAVGLKEAFSELEKIDPHFSSINLTNQQWDEVTVTFQHFKAWREFYKSFHWDDGSSIATKVVDILKLFRFHRSEDCGLCKNASYKKLFDDIQFYSLIAILDPRFKMDTLKTWYEGIYGSDVDGYFEKIIKYFRDIYNEYAKDSNDDYKMIDGAMGKPSTSSTKSELDLYLYDLRVPAVEKFNLLDWWRRNDTFYPTLAKMARDYLAIPLDPIDINSTLIDEINCICIYDEIDYDIKSALIYVRGLSYVI